MINLPSITKDPFKALALVCTIGAFTVTIGTLYFQNHTLINLTIALLAIVVTIGAYIAIDRGYKSEAATVLAWYGLTSTLILAYCTGGIESTALFFLPIGSIILGLFTDPKQALLYGVIAALSVVGLWALTRFTSTPTLADATAIDYSLGSLLSALFLITAGIYISAKNHLYTTQQLNTTLDTLSTHNAALISSEARFERVLDTLGDSIFILNSAGYVQKANGHALRTLGYTQEEMENQHGSQFSSTFDIQAVLEWFANEKQADSLTVISDLYCKTGQQIITEVRLTHFSSIDGPVVLCVARNITDRLEKEQLLCEAQKTQSMGLMAGGIAHDLNNMLVPILGQTAIALRKLDPDQPIRENLLKSMHAAKEARGLTEQLLAYAGNHTLEKELSDINALMAQNIALFNLGIPGNITLRTALTPELPAIKLDRTQFQQVMLNLIINASEAIHNKRGKIEIATAPLTLNKKRKLGTAPLSAGNYVQIKISDNGSGMTSETATRLFEPFYTTKPDGHGLGLAAVDGIVRGHQGAIHVTSTLGEGTCFELLFPVAQQPTVVKPFRI